MLVGVALFVVATSVVWGQPTPLTIGGVEFTPLEVEQPEFDVVMQVDFSLAGPQDEVVLVFDVSPDGSRHALHVSCENVFFTRSDADGSHAIGLVGSGKAPSNGPFELCLARRSWKMTAVINGAAVARAWDDQPFDGLAGYRATSARVVIDDVTCQPVGDIYFADNFMRTSKSTGEWETQSGSWVNEETIEVRGKARQEGQIDFKSVNAFSFKASGEKAAIATTGYWFWDDYAYSTSVKAEQGMMGLILRYQDPGNYLLLRVVTGSNPVGLPSLQLLRVSDGNMHELGRANPTILPSQWYRLRAETVDNDIWAYLDDELMVHAVDCTFAMGQIGLYAEKTDGAFFDDVRVRGWDVLYDDFRADAPGRWRAVTGKWSRQQGRRRSDARLVKTSKGRGLTLAGQTDWKHYTFEADVAPLENSGVGLVFHAQGPDDYYALRVGGAKDQHGYAGKAQLVKAIHGETTVLAEGPAQLAQGRPTHLQVEADGPYLAGFVDGRRVVEAVDQAITSGKVGLLADGPAGCAFDNALLRFIERRPPVVIPRSMVTDKEMKRDWASPAESWIPPERGQSISWNKGSFFGESAVEIPLKKIRAAAGGVVILVSQSEKDIADAYQVTLSTSEGTGALEAQISRGGRLVADGSTNLAEDEDDCTFRLELNGSYLMVFVDSTCIASCRIEWGKGG